MNIKEVKQVINTHIEKHYGKDSVLSCRVSEPNHYEVYNGEFFTPCFTIYKCHKYGVDFWKVSVETSNTPALRLAADIIDELQSK